MDAEARNTKRSRDESDPESDQPPKHPREAEILHSNDEDDSAAVVIEISDDEDEISAMVRGERPSRNVRRRARNPPPAESTPPSLPSMDGRDAIVIADDDEVEKAGFYGIWNSLDEISIGRRQYEGSEFGILTEFDDGGSLFHDRLVDSSDVGCGPLDFGDFSGQMESGGRLDGLI